MREREVERHERGVRRPRKSSALSRVGRTAIDSPDAAYTRMKGAEDTNIPRLKEMAEPDFENGEGDADQKRAMR